MSECGLGGCLSGRQAGAAKQCKFLASMLFVWRCSPGMEAATSVIMACGGSYKPPFVARDILAVHHQHLEAKVALGRQAGMQEDSDVESNAEPSNISHTDSYISYASHNRRICSAKLYVLRTGRHGGQRQQRLSRPSHDLSRNAYSIQVSHHMEGITVFLEGIPSKGLIRKTALLRLCVSC